MSRLYCIYGYVGTKIKHLSHSTIYEAKILPKHCFTRDRGKIVIPVPLPIPKILKIDSRVPINHECTCIVTSCSIHLRHYSGGWEIFDSINNNYFSYFDRVLLLNTVVIIILKKIKFTSCNSNPKYKISENHVKKYGVDVYQICMTRYSFWCIIF